MVISTYGRAEIYGRLATAKYRRGTSCSHLHALRIFALIALTEAPLFTWTPRTSPAASGGWTMGQIMGEGRVEVAEIEGGNFGWGFEGCVSKREGGNGNKWL